MNRAVDLALELASTVPCLEFGCLPDETAVEFLEGQLKEGGL